MAALTEKEGVRLKERQVMLLRCTVRDGMFPHEVDVLIRGLDRTYEAMLDRTAAGSPAEGDGWIRVRVDSVDPARKAVLVELPGQVVMGGSRIWVERDSLMEAP